MSCIIFSCWASTPFSCISFSNNDPPPPVPFAGILPLTAKDKREHFGSRPLRSALSKRYTQEYASIQAEAEALNIHEYVKTIKSILGSMEDGKISISAYDTAWVAMIQNVNHSGIPQFPSTLEWIANNQLADGSWGHARTFEAHDRLINTLACVIALKTWNIHPDKCQKGLTFLKEIMSKLENENAEHMTCGFEVIFPSLLDIAQSLNIQISYDAPILQDIYVKRSLKLKRIPNAIMHNMPTTLLFSLEGMAGLDLDWEKLLKLQCQDGSFLFSPSSTAFAYMQTKDENCLKYVKKIVERFNGGVPNVYPIDVYERLWCVDRLERLGISRYFQHEIKQCLDYVYRYWSEEGIGWARNIPVMDIDDTAMGFRLLRLHGYEVSAEVFQHFEKDGKFFCFARESNQSVSINFNLYRASQVMFPEEKILEDAKMFSSNFLMEKQTTNQILDKWIITKDLSGEVALALKIPWYAILPRLETRFYLEQYGGEDVVWIAKTLYRLWNVNNNVYLDLAKQDYNICQAVLQMEWDNLQKWYSEMNLGEFGVSYRSLLLNYFLAAASIFEPERSQERLAWTKTAFLVEIIFSFYDNHIKHVDYQRAFLQIFRGVMGVPFHRHRRGHGRRFVKNVNAEKLIDIILQTLNHLSLDASEAHGQDISGSLRHAWERWMMKWEEEGDRKQGVPELLVKTISLSSGCCSLEHIFSHPQYRRLCTLTNTICNQLSHFQFQDQKMHDDGCYNSKIKKIENQMQQLVELVLSNSLDYINSDMKQTFLIVARSFYYAAHCDMDTIELHITKVLFEKVQ